MAKDIDGWIPLDEWCLKYGDKANTVHKRIHDGLWLRGEMLSSPDGTGVFVHEARAKAWMKARGKLK